MEQDRQSHLTSMSLDCGMVTDVDFNDIIKDFASREARGKNIKKHFQNQ